MKCVVDSKGFQEIWKFVELQRDEFALRLLPEGMFFRVFDQSGNAFIEIIVDKNKFIEYNVDKQIDFGINIRDLSKILKRVNDKNNLELVFDERTITVINGKKEFTMANWMIDFIEKEIKPPEPSNIITLDTISLKEVLEDVLVIDDIVSINVDSESKKSVFSGKNDSAKGKIEVDTPEVKESGVVMYNIKDFLFPMIRASTTDKIRLMFAIGNGKNLLQTQMDLDLGTMRYYLAPLQVRDE